MALALCSAQAQMPADLDPDSGARLPYPTRAHVLPDGQRVADIFARNGGPEDPVSGPLAFAAYNPKVAVALLDLHDASVGGVLEANTRELSILVACRETNYSFEWNAHLQAALNAGVGQSVIDAVKNGSRLRGLSEHDATVIRFGRELLGEHDVSSETFAKAVDVFGEEATMNIVAVMMTYAVSGFYAIAVDEHPPGMEMLEPLD
jgi:alkylhydroperoxidase family enzyme